ncbi:MAG: M6 family metalloprotease domain-containing protein [Prevotella sp.]|nr:M6 family metalloprotease domain-containing protein [Prevotella sp.]
MRQKVLLTVLMSILTLTISASRVKGEWRVYKQPDGTTLTLMLVGDEYNSHFVSPDGKIYDQDEQGVFHMLTASEVQRRKAMALGARHKLPAINKDWDPNKTYRQLVILVSFSDTDFSMEKPQETYDSIFNVSGYNQRDGAGCMADYFREQSGGMFNLQFDVYGPIKVSSKAQPYENPNDKTRNYGKEPFMEATRKLIESEDIDFSVYDWNNDGSVNQVLFVYAGYCGNQGVGNVNGVTISSYGYVWPVTSSFSTITTPDSKKISKFTASGELYLNNANQGIGTFCHEFTHSLGLPDLYPTGDSPYFSVMDEWDLMDGGNFTNWGWCPPNYSSFEKMQLGWLTPTELTEPTTITGMKSVADGGEVYIIKHTDNEFYLLENRQWKGWDVGLPGKGLLILHVDYSKSAWSGNVVNNNSNHFRYDIVHADNLDYNDWKNLFVKRELRSQYQQAPRLHNIHLSTSAYPWATDSTETVNRELTNTSIPASIMYNENDKESTLLSKSITNIQMTEDGLISFDFMGGSTVDGISIVQEQSKGGNGRCTYDLQGRRMDEYQLPKGIYIIRKADGTAKKVIQH